ncbi:MAG: hypothetical protein WKH64_14590 [Chloroflexia bacterium]
MPSHMSSIGFRVRTDEDFSDIAVLAATSGELIESSGGAYVRWGPGAGVELWAQVAADHRIVGPTRTTEAIPLCESDSSRGSSVETTTTAASTLGHSQTLTATTRTMRSTRSSSTRPTTVCTTRSSSPRKSVSNLPRSPTKAEAYPDEDAYGAHNGRSTTGLGSRPSRSYPPGCSSRAGETSHPEAFAILSGTVMQAVMLVNPVAGVSFHWAKVRTLGGEVDLVADPEVLVGELTEGGVVSGVFWLSGRIEG